MTTLGLVARADHGGLAAQTLELYRHLHPDRTLIVDLGDKGMGPADHGRYQPDHPEMEAVATQGFPTAEQAGWLAECDVVFTVEATYGLELSIACRRARTRLIVQANPELVTRSELQGAELIFPTSWMADHFPGARVIPVPVALDRFTRRSLPERLEVLYHPAAPAMLDRNGTELVLEAMRWVEHPMLLVIGAREHRQWPLQIGNVKVRTALPVQNYWDAYLPEYDAMILPRRYGGLCLSLQEAAAQGMARITTDRTPEKEWWGTVRAKVGDRYRAAMKSGAVMVESADPRLLAAEVNRLAAFPDELARSAGQSHDWAWEHSWDRLLPVYQELLGRT